MKRPTWWQRAAAYWSHPLVLIMPVCATGLAIVACSLAKYGFRDAIPHRLLIGLCAGLLFSLFWKWDVRRGIRFYVDEAVGLRSPDIGSTALQAVVAALCMMPVTIAADGRDRWIAFGAYLFAMILLYPEAKALHEGIKAKLAEMENTPEQDEMA